MRDNNWIYRSRAGKVLFDLNLPVFLTSSALIGLFVVERVASDGCQQVHCVHLQRSALCEFRKPGR